MFKMYFTNHSISAFFENFLSVSGLANYHKKGREEVWYLTFQDYHLKTGSRSKNILRVISMWPQRDKVSARSKIHQNSAFFCFWFSLHSIPENRLVGSRLWKQMVSTWIMAQIYLFFSYIIYFYSKFLKHSKFKCFSWTSQLSEVVFFRQSHSNLVFLFSVYFYCFFFTFSTFVLFLSSHDYYFLLCCHFILRYQ